MNDALPFSKDSTLASSPDVVKAGPTTPEVPTAFITSAARVPGSSARPSWMSAGSSAFSVITDPPADSMRALSQTVRASARMPWAASWVSWDCAASISWSQVTGWVMSRPAASATDFWYQSSWVLAQNGTVTSSPSQLAAWTALCTTPSVTRPATSSGTGARKPASANSGMRSEEHTSELQSRQYLVCRLLLEKKKE